MPIKLDEYNKVCVMAIDGDLSGLEIEPLRSAFDKKVETEQIVDFVIDFEKSGFVDSEGLELLLSMNRKCEDLFGQIKLAGLDENVKKILEITRIAQKFECAADVAAALKNMR